MAQRPLLNFCPGTGLLAVVWLTFDPQSTASQPWVTVSGRGRGNVSSGSQCGEAKYVAKHPTMHKTGLPYPNKELSNPKCYPWYQGYSSKGDRETLGFWKQQRTQEHVRDMLSRTELCPEAAAGVLQRMGQR